MVKRIRGNRFEEGCDYDLQTNHNLVKICHCKRSIPIVSIILHFNTGTSRWMYCSIRRFAQRDVPRGTTILSLFLLTNP